LLIEAGPFILIKRNLKVSDSINGKQNRVYVFFEGSKDCGNEEKNFRS
jgi:hypothetical protein